MDIKELSLQDCPICGGVGIFEEEQGWCINISCLDCGCQTADVGYKTPEGRQQAIDTAVELWNLGKVVAIGPGT